MVIINRSGIERYSVLAHRALAPGRHSADVDMGGFAKALANVVKSCGNSLIVRLNDSERAMLARLQTLDEAGRNYRAPRMSPPKTQVQINAEREASEKQARIASIEAARKKEEAIMAETTYASRKDIDHARSSAARLHGDVDAKKLDQKDVTGTVSLTDLMGDNRFIEESMKHSNVPTAVASEEGWDMGKMNEAKVAENSTDKDQREEPLIDPVAQGTQPEKPAKKTRRSKK